jgi:hypothetical protein
MFSTCTKRAYIGNGISKRVEDDDRIMVGPWCRRHAL